MLLSLLAITAGTLAAYFIVSYILTQDDPYRRVALLYTIMATDLVVSILAYILLSNQVFLLVSIFTLTKFITWVTLIPPEYIVHHQLED